ncbi:MAG: hypothetical protein HY746_02995 [Elusimicrobia bacterium]|nr:hypothetical protein [Elusimicrobiota bacterium]
MKLGRILFLGIPAAILMVAGIFAVGILLIKLFWTWTIPELFPHAVAQGLVAAKISWWTALKLTVFVSLLVAVASIKKGD